MGMPNQIKRLTEALLRVLVFIIPTVLAPGKLFFKAVYTLVIGSMAYYLLNKEIPKEIKIAIGSVIAWSLPAGISAVFDYPDILSYYSLIPMALPIIVFVIPAGLAILSDTGWEATIGFMICVIIYITAALVGMPLEENQLILVTKTILHIVLIYAIQAGVFLFVRPKPKTETLF